MVAGKYNVNTRRVQVVGSRDDIIYKTSTLNKKKKPHLHVTPVMISIINYTTARQEKKVK